MSPCFGGQAKFHLSFSHHEKKKKEKSKAFIQNLYTRDDNFGK